MEQTEQRDAPHDLPLGREGNLRAPLLDDRERQGVDEDLEHGGELAQVAGEVTGVEEHARCSDDEADGPREDVAMSIREAVDDIVQAVWPQVMVIFCRLLITVTDTAIVGRLGTDELAAAGFANMVIQLSIQVIWSGCGEGLISLTSQAMGAENRFLAGVWLEIACAVSLAFAVPIAFCWWNTGEILRLVKLPGSEHDNEHVMALATRFGRLSLLWLLPDVLSDCFAQWINGLDRVARTVPIHIFAVIFNIGANLILVHGVGSWHGLGFDGSPLATTSTTVLRFIMLVLYMPRHLPKGVFAGVSFEHFTKDRILSFMGQFVPNASTAVLEQAQFVVLTVFIASFGEKQLAAHTIMMNTFDLCSAALYGMTEGGSMSVGRELGRGFPVRAKALSWYLVAAMTVVALIVTTLFLVFPHQIGAVFSSDPEVIEYTAELSIVSGASYFLIALTFASYAVLQGQGRPAPAVAAMFGGVWVVGIPASYLLCFHLPWLHAGFLGAWLGSNIGYVVMTIIMSAAVYYSDWDQIARDARERAEVEASENAAPAASPLLARASSASPSPSLSPTSRPFIRA
ncbi:Protein DETOXIFICATION 16 [Hondaea fermentalgiana]|uniref:Protein DETOXIFICATION 16 n=1 Tax=Hondaea fermentalgiana TaxID=2315210 RepID=A0A2R5GYB3_9STRA|nr:Protein DETOXIFICATION 16 [Hondaea fermentalgiana]|eukprot:GBG34798.1 Protein DETOXIFICATION 16 [Hondaea fermentalgiana]